MGARGAESGGVARHEQGGWCDRMRRGREVPTDLVPRRVQGGHQELAQLQGRSLKL